MPQNGGVFGGDAERRFLDAHGEVEEYVRFPQKAREKLFREQEAVAYSCAKEDSDECLRVMAAEYDEIFSTCISLLYRLRQAFAPLKAWCEEQMNIAEEKVNAPYVTQDVTGREDDYTLKMRSIERARTHAAGVAEARRLHEELRIYLSEKDAMFNEDCKSAEASLQVRLSIVAKAWGRRTKVDAAGALKLALESANKARASLAEEINRQLLPEQPDGGLSDSLKVLSPSTPDEQPKEDDIIDIPPEDIEFFDE